MGLGPWAACVSADCRHEGCFPVGSACPVLLCEPIRKADSEVPCALWTGSTGQVGGVNGSHRRVPPPEAGVRDEGPYRPSQGAKSAGVSGAVVPSPAGEPRH
jgi:hypothetical protein